jgi:hypothetical protein
MKTQPEIFSVSVYNQGFTGILAIKQNLNLKAAETLVSKLNQESGKSHFIYAPELSLVENQTPSRGHAIKIVTGYYVKGIGIIQDDQRLGRDENRLQVTLSPSTYCNPNTILDGKISLSASGGPCPHLLIANMTRNGNTHQQFWYARDGYLTGGCAVEYFIEVPLWEYNGAEE